MNKSELTKFTGISRLTMVIYHLQVKRVKELLTETEILEKLPTMMNFYKQTPIIELC